LPAPSTNSRMSWRGYFLANVSRKIWKHCVSGAGMIRYLAEVGFKALPGFVRDLKDYEVALLEGKAITETGQKELNDQAFVVVNGIAGAVLEAGRRLVREIGKTKQTERDRGGRGR
jgi:hypothetical protein